MAERPSPKKRIKALLYFFPVRLIFFHFRSGHLLLMLWVFLFGIVLKKFLVKYGAYNLFLYPEYLDRVGILSHLLLGFGIGVFIMGYQISYYILFGRYFAFLATLRKPFLVFSLNNALIPLAFVLVYGLEMYDYQHHEQLMSSTAIFINLFGFLLGLSLSITITLTYFTQTNLNIERTKPKEKMSYRPIQSLLTRREKWYLNLPTNEWRVGTYLTPNFSIRAARGIEHYSKETIKLVFMQNHINATLFDIGLIIALLVFSFFRASEWFILPAAVNFLLLFSILLMFISAIYSWFKSWSVLIFFILFVGYDQLANRAGIRYENYAYGLPYDQKVPYSNAFLQGLTSDTVAVQEDVEREILILNRWKSSQEKEKPKLLIINVSGGGSRAALWAMSGFQKMDSVLDGKLMTKTHLISGSSGGLIGAAYYRALYRSSSSGGPVQPNDPMYREAISRDLLNPVAFDFSLNDWIFRLRGLTYAGYNYPQDRGYAFENQLNKNTYGFLKGKLSDYHNAEKNGQLPTMIFAPSIANDGRRMIISTRRMTFLTKRYALDRRKNTALIDAVDFHQLFQPIKRDSLRYLSVLRMNATFFYILPIVSLPTEPRIEVLDAGFRDNLGMLTTLAYARQFKNWIMENTSGVVIVRLVDHEYQTFVQEQPEKSFIESVRGPVAGLYQNYLNIQDFNQDLLLNQLNTELEGKTEVITIEIPKNETRRASLSWHLTNSEKKLIVESFSAPSNQKALQRLKTLME
jgi:hypothetical protein